MSRFSAIIAIISKLLPDAVRSPAVEIVTASAKRLYRDIGVEELIPWIWSWTNHHDIS